MGQGAPWRQLNSGVREHAIPRAEVNADDRRRQSSWHVQPRGRGVHCQPNVAASHQRSGSSVSWRGSSRRARSGCTRERPDFAMTRSLPHVEALQTLAAADRLAVDSHGGSRGLHFRTAARLRRGRLPASTGEMLDAAGVQAFDCVRPRRWWFVGIHAGGRWLYGSSTYRTCRCSPPRHSAVETDPPRRGCTESSDQRLPHGGSTPMNSTISRPTPRERAGAPTHRRDQLPGGGMGPDHPMAWCHVIGTRTRVSYTRSPGTRSRAGPSRRSWSTFAEGWHRKLAPPVDCTPELILDRMSLPGAPMSHQMRKCASGHLGAGRDAGDRARDGGAQRLGLSHAFQGISSSSRKSSRTSLVTPEPPPSFVGIWRTASDACSRRSSSFPRRGPRLELGANPYFLTMLFRRFRRYELELAEFLRRPRGKTCNAFHNEVTGESHEFRYREFQ